MPPEKLIQTAEEFTPDGIRVFRQVHEWLETKYHEEERIQLHREYEQKVHSGEFPQHETLLPLYP